ncbi:hypothetical protein P171DRAFT_478790 [Karstenula rhodostoma CBS 690.94]|uniref:Uncharacterized protein n=1 Tax=Karstenula rhodostoma CBS 690.94 TaxID=1392251 RepID=A0A9P4PZJ6_9PLEO|nr:hypothetical protein P171DRAFT_478790 [Karstenula rhodostoma CBS 690.94]
MLRNTYTAFQRHLLFFSTPTNPPRLTVLSGMRAAASLGLDFPICVLLGISLRALYAPFPHVFSPINIERIPQSEHRAQLSYAKLDKQEYCCSDLLSILPQDPRKGFLKHKIDQGHIVSFWAMSASTNTHTVSRDDVERFQRGDWGKKVAERRRGRDDVLPLWRGGPIIVSWHSWAIRRVLGVRVYEENPKTE